MDILSLISLLLLSSTVVNASHFNGGTITWAPINPYDNSSTVNIVITQSYFWTYPSVNCTTNVPITTNSYSNSNTNLTCMSDCATDGGYSLTPIDILTDCISYSNSLNMMSSERSVNITLNSSAYFYLSHTGAAWRTLNDPPENNLSWSIVSLINLQRRDDGIINTPPVANIISPQYVIVNTTSQINIPVSDVNTGDDVRCRWSRYQSGYRRRRQIDEDSSVNVYSTDETKNSYKRKKRQGCSLCNSGTCWQNCSCGCPSCDPSICTGSHCSIAPYCPSASTTTSFLHLPIDECGGICHPRGLPNDTALSNCTVSFTGLIPSTWYAISLQVEDFINETSMDAMSSIPVQFLIYVLPTPTCSVLPVILPLTSCMNVKVGVTVIMGLYAMNLCGSNVMITDILMSKPISSMVVSNVINSTTNSSLSYITLTWTPRANQIGLQKMCAIAYNNLLVQSIQYCVIFTVTSTTPNCSITSGSGSGSGSSTTTKASTTPQSSINIPLIVGLSLMAALLTLCCCACSSYYFYRKSADQNHRRNSQKNNARYEERRSLNPFSHIRDCLFKKNNQKYVLHKKSHHRSTKSMNASRTQSTFPSTPKIRTPITFRSPKVSDIRITNQIDQSITEENGQFKLPRRQSFGNTTPSSYSTVRVTRVSRPAVSIEDSNIYSEKLSTPSLPKVRVTKLPRQKQTEKNDDNHPNLIKDNVQTATVFAISNAPVDPKGNTIVVQSDESGKRRHSLPVNTNLDNNQDFYEESSQRMDGVHVSIVPRPYSKTPNSKDHRKSTLPTNNGATLTVVSKKQLKNRSPLAGYRKNIVDVIEMS